MNKPLLILYLEDDPRDMEKYHRRFARFGARDNARLAAGLLRQSNPRQPRRRQQSKHNTCFYRPIYLLDTPLDTGWHGLLPSLLGV